MKRQLHTFSALVISSSLLFVAPLALTACHSTTTTTRANEGLTLNATASNSVINQGEIVTFIVHDKGTLGKDIDIKWSSNGGDIKTEQNGRVARVQFDKPGTYSVTTKYWIDGNLDKTQTNVVTVKRIPS